jgi:3-hydroxyacyl-CoA dehydrogenase
MRRSVSLAILGAGIMGMGLSTLVAGGSNVTTQDVVTTSSVQEVTANIIGAQTTFSLTAALAESPAAFWFWAPG